MTQSFFDGASRTGHCPSFVNILVCTGKPDTRVGQDGFDRSCPAPKGEWMYGPTGSDPYWVNPDGNAARQVAAYT